MNAARSIISIIIAVMIMLFIGYWLLLLRNSESFDAGPSAEPISETPLNPREEQPMPSELPAGSELITPDVEFDALQISPTPATPSPTPESTPALKIIVIDPGHQAQANNQQEPIGPGATQMKARTSGGTMGVASGVPEHKLNLVVSLLLREELISRGYEVYLTRETHDVDLSNIERAAIAEEFGADAFIRIHANGDSNSSTHGMLTISPTSKNPYIPPGLYERSFELSQFILDEMTSETGAHNRGIWETDTMAGINWAVMPVTIVEMGFMTNPEEDILMQEAEYQAKIVRGIANGIDAFFAQQYRKKLTA